jgi:hypothetical protein
MNGLLKLGVIIVIGFFGLRWLSNRLSSSLTPSIGGGSIVGNGWAPPVVFPGPIYPWAPPYYWRSPWQNFNGAGNGPTQSYFPTGYGRPVDGYRNSR